MDLTHRFLRTLTPLALVFVLVLGVAQTAAAQDAPPTVSAAPWPEDSNPTRLFFAPTGRALKRGDAYFGVYEFFMPFAQYGVSDRFSIGGGTPLFVGTGPHPVWVTPKLQVLTTSRTQAAIGAMHFFNVDHNTFGVAYGAVTHGNRDSAVSVGVGWAYSGNSRSTSGTGVLMVGGEHRVSTRMKLITENYVVRGHVMLTGGVRILSEKLSADIGWFSPMVEGHFVAVPMFNFVWKLGK